MMLHVRRSIFIRLPNVSVSDVSRGGGGTGRDGASWVISAIRLCTLEPPLELEGLTEENSSSEQLLNSSDGKEKRLS